MDNRFFKLPLQYDPARLGADLATCEARQWVDHFNKTDFNGNWTGISLRSASGDSADIYASVSAKFSDTPLLDDCPYFREILSAFPFEIETVRLLALSPGSVILEHRDMGLGYEYGCFRLHIPIVTDEKVLFTVDGCHLNMEAGHCWYANFDLPHSVQHNGAMRRIHLVVDGIRNAQTDVLFGEAGFNFTLEQRKKEHDPATKLAMIAQLKYQDNDAARALIAELEASLRMGVKPPSGSALAASTEDWAPTGLIDTENGKACQWMHLGGISFTAPFFDQTLSEIRILPANKKKIAAVSTLEFMIAEGSKVDYIPPDAFIFHVSRCGSTLLTQLLSLDAQNIVLSETPLFDGLLRLPKQSTEISEEVTLKAFAAALQWMGRRRTGIERHLFVKTDCWHVFFYPEIRRLFPTTPIVLLYRDPGAVLVSQQKIRGIQSIPETLEPSITGISIDAFKAFDFDGYFSCLLERILARFVGIAADDPHAILVNYAEGPMCMIDKLTRATGIKLSENKRRAMEKRSLFDAKKPQESFTPMQDVPSTLASLQASYAWYRELEEIRLALN